MTIELDDEETRLLYAVVFEHAQEHLAMRTRPRSG